MLLIPLLLAACAPAATGVIAGRVHEQGSSDPVAGAVAQLIDATGYAESDERGRFLLEAPDGAQGVMLRASGFGPKILTVAVPEGGTVTVDAALVRTEVKADEVVVRGRREAAESSRSEVTRDEIKHTPGTAGDALRAVANLPGVAMMNDYWGQMMVRGGGPQDNLYLIDNVPWPVPFHFGGIVSTVNSDLLQEVDLQAGAFGPRWGNAQDAVLDARTRPGEKDRLHASADLNLVMSEALLEGPMGVGDASWAAGTRRSYFDLLLGSLFRGGLTLLPRFWDAGGSLDATLSAHDRVRAIGLATDDRLGIAVPSSDTAFGGDIHYRNTYRTGGATWIDTSFPGLRSVMTPYAFDYLYDVGLGGFLGTKWDTRAQGIKEDLSWDAGETWGGGHIIEVGGVVEEEHDTSYSFLDVGSSGGGTDFNFTSTVSGRGWYSGCYLQDRVKFGSRFTVAAGGRYDRSQFASRSTLTPRVSVEWVADSVTTLRAAGGTYSQFPKGWQVNKDFGNPRLEPSFADHAVFGVERRITRQLLGRVEAYVKRYRDQISASGNPRRANNDMIGDAQGVEVYVKENLGERFFGWVSYAYSRSRRRDEPGQAWHLYQYDQPHIATVVASYAFAPSWRLGAKWRYNSGPLYTPIVSRYQDEDGVWQGVEGAPYSKRLAPYIRLDLRLEYAFRYSRWKLSLYGEVLNALNRSNPAGIEYSEDSSETQQWYNFPRIPYMGLEAKF